MGAGSGGGRYRFATRSLRIGREGVIAVVLVVIERSGRVFLLCGDVARVLYFVPRPAALPTTSASDPHTYDMHSPPSLPLPHHHNVQTRHPPLLPALPTLLPPFSPRPQRLVRPPHAAHHAPNNCANPPSRQSRVHTAKDARKALGAGATGCASRCRQLFGDWSAHGNGGVGRADGRGVHAE